MQPEHRSPVGGYDVAIVGGGVVGCAIAWRLSFTTASVVLIEAAHDVGEGASKGNTGIATCGADCAPGTLEAELVTRSSPGWEELCRSLDTPWRRMGTLAVAVTEKEERGLEHVREQARRNGCEAEIVSGEAARSLEQLVTPSARAAVHIPQDGIIDSLRLTIGYAELAARNGVDVLRLDPGDRVPCRDGRITAVQTGRGRSAPVMSSTPPASRPDACRRSRAARSSDVAAPGAVLAARPGAWPPVREDRRRGAHRRDARDLLRPDHQHVAAARPHGRRHRLPR